MPAALATSKRLHTRRRSLRNPEGFTVCGEYKKYQEKLTHCFYAVKYRLPPVFFASSVKPSNLVQAIDFIPQHLLDVAEACNLQPSQEAILGDDQYIFTR